MFCFISKNLTIYKLFFFLDVKPPSLSQSVSTPIPLQHGLDRNTNIKLQSTASTKMHLTAPTSRSAHVSLPTYALQTNNSNALHSHQSNVLPYSANTTTKYDLTHASPHPLHNTNGNYLHSNALSQSAYCNSVKSETNSSNYDYCIQSGYFGSSFSSLGASASAHVSPDLAGYHHQHNVIQAAKLMASS